MRTLIREIIAKEGESVVLEGWVRNRRDHGKLIFIDIKDRSGMAQVVFLPKPEEVHAIAADLRSEWVIRLTGKVNKRPDNMVNADQEFGGYEILAEGLEILNKAEDLPIPIDTDGREIGEEARMKYRAFDLRRERMEKNMKMRAKVVNFFRNYLSNLDFIEVETPILGKATPEGSRDYLVPSRIYPGKCYALPQSPQQYKQLLMVAGLERYFQIARCFRDEDTRGDRQPEFTQLDMEMSFVQREDVMEVVEDMLIKLVQTHYPEKRIQQIPFPRITYKDAMEQYGNDRPDMREDKNDPNLLAFNWVIEFPFFEKDEETGGWTFTHNPFSAPKPEHMESLMNKENIADILTTQYDIVLNGYEIGGGSIRNHHPEALRKVLEIMGFSDEKIKSDYGHMLEAFKLGAPPHGGIAPGVDRIVMILQGEPNIREVIAFPKTGDGRDLMMEAPSEFTETQLRELKLKVIK
jgi:aspartyl-tRNA synthetase